ncbi:hypothetical protein K491DRAFT_682221 [Lophiostoma macrostomum CBS 122681]|uniref:Uncharacterized protein n=1 Tax=Lophiostoma macrostomum CBS 122681 TaxID=1314788 RepID=A0A6A6SYU8_9PLEO|nr:hypothetical protein K491DRAFT_682221 [Lophiostoma macrostomum CBS 122681]
MDPSSSKMPKQTADAKPDMDPNNPNWVNEQLGSSTPKSYDIEREFDELMGDAPRKKSTESFEFLEWLKNSGSSQASLGSLDNRISAHERREKGGTSPPSNKSGPEGGGVQITEKIEEVINPIAQIPKGNEFEKMKNWKWNQEGDKKEDKTEDKEKFQVKEEMALPKLSQKEMKEVSERRQSQHSNLMKVLHEKEQAKSQKKGDVP